MVFEQGDIIWANRRPPAGSEPGGYRPFVVIQNDVFNASRLGTVVCCALTRNLKRAASPGNVLLRKGEANLPGASVVNITQVETIDRSAFTEKIGTLGKARIRQILDGLRLLLEPREL
jgi:mRNA interferase MazF